MMSLPAEQRLLDMSEVFYFHIPELVALIFEDRKIVGLVIGGVNGIKCENSMSELVRRDAHAISAAAESIKAQGLRTFERQTLELMTEEELKCIEH